MNFSTTPIHNTTTPPEGHLATEYGLIAIAVSTIFFGVVYLPIKKFETGDGMFFQWVFSNSIFLCSFIANGILRFPKFEPLVMVGGFLWATGNICIVPVSNVIGLGLGGLLWGSATIILAWASARFGWFGIIPQLPNNLTLNYIGFVFTAISPFIYLTVKTEVSEEIIVNIGETIDNSQMVNNLDNINKMKYESLFNEKSESRKQLQQRIIAIVWSLFAGTLFGLMFVPATYVKNRYPNSSQKDIDYIFPQCAGIYLGSSIYFIIYCIYKRNQPILYPKSILPGILSGVIWFIGYVGLFIANQVLNPAISQPIISALPGLISVIITTVVFKEIRGLRNYLLIALAILITGVGVTLMGLSKII